MVHTEHNWDRRQKINNRKHVTGCITVLSKCYTELKLLNSTWSHSIDQCMVIAKWLFLWLIMGAVSPTLQWSKGANIIRCCACQSLESIVCTQLSQIPPFNGQVLTVETPHCADDSEILNINFKGKNNILSQTAYCSNYNKPSSICETAHTHKYADTTSLHFDHDTWTWGMLDTGSCKLNLNTKVTK